MEMIKFFSVQSNIKMGEYPKKKEEKDESNKETT